MRNNSYSKLTNAVAVTYICTTEGGIFTYSTVIHDFHIYNNEEKNKQKLFDMEAAGIYQAAAYFFSHIRYAL